MLRFGRLGARARGDRLAAELLEHFERLRRRCAALVLIWQTSHVGEPINEYADVTCDTFGIEDITPVPRGGIEYTLSISSKLPHECRTSQCRPSQSTGDAPRRCVAAGGVVGGAHRGSSPRPRRDPHVHPRHDETTPASEHTAALRALRTSCRLTLGHQAAEPMHRCTRLHPSPHPAPALCFTLQPPCAGARPRR